MLKVRGLEAGYGDVQVLWGVDLEVAEGEIVALVGSNGAGKTTLLKSLISSISPQRGEILLDGQPIQNLPTDRIIRKGVVYVPEGRRLFAGMTVEENLLMGAYCQRDKNTVDRGLERVYGYFPVLRERRKQLAGQLSGGEQQMCAIGRGLMAQPRLMLLDELSLGLAPVFVDHLMEVVEEIHREGVSLLIVEQDVQLALDIADRGYVLEGGRVILADNAPALAASEKVKVAYLGV